MKTERNLPTIIDRLLFSETPLWAGWTALCRVVSKVRSWCLSWVLNAPGLHLGPGCVVRGSKFIKFGKNVYVHGHLWMEAIASYRNQEFSPRIEIGEDVSFSDGVHISCIERISIGKGVLFGSRVYVSDHNHGIYNGPVQSHPQEPPSHRQLGGGGVVEIGDHVWIGDNVVIVGPLTIGRGSIVGANSVVRANVPEFTIVGGIPASALKRFEQSTGRWEKS